MVLPILLNACVLLVGATAQQSTSERALELPRESGHSWPYRPPEAAAPDGSRLALVMPGPRLVVIDLEEGCVLYETSLGLEQGETEPVTMLAWSPGGSRVVAKYSVGVAQVVDASTGSIQRELALAGRKPGARSAPTVRWVDDDLLLATGAEGPLELWSIESGERLHSFEPLGGPTTAFGLSPDRELLAVGDHSGSVSVWHVRDGQFAGRIPAQGVPINGLAFDARKTRLAVALHASEAVVWSLETWSEVARASHADANIFGDLEVGRVALSPDGQVLVTTSSPFWEVRAWSVEDGRELWRHDYGGGNAGFMSAYFSSDGSRVLMGLRGLVVDARSGVIQKTLAPSKDLHTWVSTSGDLAWIYYDGCLRHWSLADAELAPRDIELPFEAR